MFQYFCFNPRYHQLFLLLRYFVGYKCLQKINSKSVTVAEKITLSTVLIVQKNLILPKIEQQ